MVLAVSRPRCPYATVCVTRQQVAQRAHHLVLVVPGHAPHASLHHHDERLSRDPGRSREMRGTLRVEQVALEVHHLELSFFFKHTASDLLNTFTYDTFEHIKDFRVESTTCTFTFIRNTVWCPRHSPLQRELVYAAEDIAVRVAVDLKLRIPPSRIPRRRSFTDAPVLTPHLTVSTASY